MPGFSDGDHRCRARRVAAAGKWAKAKRLALQLFAGNEVVSVSHVETVCVLRGAYAEGSSGNLPFTMW